jgi:hypothetical protein
MTTYLNNGSQYLQHETRCFRHPGQTDERWGRREGDGATERHLATRSQIASDLSLLPISGTINRQESCHVTLPIPETAWAQLRWEQIF